MKKVKLVLSGSGVKFPVFVGALKRLEEAGFSFSEAVGTSGGSVIAAALASGLTIKQMEELCIKLMPEIGGLLDPSLYSLLTEYGFIQGKKFQSVLDKYFVDTMGKAHIPVHIVATNFDTESKVVFSNKSHPSLGMSRAVRASMSIPVVFAPTLIEGDWYLDGGVFANFAIDFFGDDPDVIGLQFGSPGKKRQPRPSGLKGAFVYIARTINMLINAQVQETKNEDKIIYLQTKTDGLDFFLDAKQVTAMIQEGYLAADKWLKEKKQ